MADIEPWTLESPLPRQIDTERLVLRAVDLEMVAIVDDVVNRSIDHLRPYMSWAGTEPIGLDARRQLIERWMTVHSEGGEAVYTVLLDGAAIGACGLHPRTRRDPGKGERSGPGPATVEIGYWIAADHNGRGYATELARALTETARIRNDIDVVVLRTDATNHASQAVAAKAGFHFSHRCRVTPEAPAHSGVEYVWRHIDLPGFTIRPETPADNAAIEQVVADAFGSEVEARLVSDIRASVRYRPELSLVAEIDDPAGDHGRRIVGHVMISGCDLRTGTDSDQSVEIAMLSPLATHPDQQRHGVGSALVWEVLKRARQGGEPLVILEGNPDFYRRFGFVPAVEHGIVIHLPDWAPPEAAQVMIFDAARSDLTGTVVYPPAFDGLD